MSTEWNTYARPEAEPPPGGSHAAAPPPGAADIAAAENPVGITPEQCERHRLAYLRALLAELRGRGR